MEAFEEALRLNGFENITVDAVDYTNNQIDLMEQFVKWAERVPEIV